ncbi:hypothetical protein GPK52_04850 [Sutterella wadsworthensis]|uniref:hypothetical protein n=1 Tax=Sutterella wadsworthensis TaxID=40545 RepID=UPI001C024F46|nr:hypothetical protein [Sutterella wadsworthensis]MBT9622335.1 hypothetical protein [Sutterella wadsworthensis]
MNKDLLRAFGKASAMNAFPSSQKIDIPVVAEQWWNEYVAPADGFVFVSGETHAGEAGGGAAEVSTQASFLRRRARSPSTTNSTTTPSGESSGELFVCACEF